MYSRSRRAGLRLAVFARRRRRLLTTARSPSECLRCCRGTVSSEASAWSNSFTGYSSPFTSTTLRPRSTLNLPSLALELRETACLLATSVSGRWRTIDKVGQLLWAWFSFPRKSANKIVEPWHSADIIVCNFVRRQLHEYTTANRKNDTCITYLCILWTKINIIA